MINVPIRTDEQGLANCPICKHPVRVVQRQGRHVQHSDHYEHLKMTKGWDASELKPVDRFTANKLKKLRKGKKTVAMVGMAPTSCSLAPFEDKDVEIWAMNETHHWPWLKRADRWFQIHHTDSWKRDLAKRGVTGHLEWLQENPWNIPIYMQYWNEEVPKSVAYPLREVCAKFFKNFRRGDAKIKYFTSTLAYMFGIALLEEPRFDRIELYGFEMAATVEYIEQKGCGEFWMGLAMGLGVEIYVPPGCILMWSSLYGGNEQGAGW